MIQAHLTCRVLFRVFTSVSRCFNISEGRMQKCQKTSAAYQIQINVKEMDLPLSKRKCSCQWSKEMKFMQPLFIGSRFRISHTLRDRRLLPVVLMAVSWALVIPSVVLHSSSSFSSSSLWLPPASGSKDWLRPLSLSLQFCPEQLPSTGEELHWEDEVFVGLMATSLPWDTGARGVEVGGTPFLP